MWYLIVGCFLVAACSGESLYADVIDHARIKRQHQQAPAGQQINYQPVNRAPQRIQHLLQQQQYREPLIHLPAPAPPQLQPQPSPEYRGAAQPQQQQLQQAQPAQYTPKVQYGQAPSQPTYKGIQAQPAPVHQQQGPQLQGGYSPQYKQQYAPQQPSPNAIYRPGPAGGYQGQQQQPQGIQPSNNYPKNLPPHIQKIIESQRSYQG